MQEKRIVRSATDSLVRLSETKAEVSSGMDTAPLTRHMGRLTKPGSPSSAMRKAGVLLIVGTPDPVTAVPGVALLAASYAIKRKDPAKLDDIAVETRKLLRDFQSLSL